MATAATSAAMGKTTNMAGHGAKRIYKSRYDSISTFICNCGGESCPQEKRTAVCLYICIYVSMYRSRACGRRANPAHNLTRSPSFFISFRTSHHPAIQRCRVPRGRGPDGEAQSERDRLSPRASHCPPLRARPAGDYEGAVRRCSLAALRRCAASLRCVGSGLAPRAHCLSRSTVRTLPRFRERANTLPPHTPLRRVAAYTWTTKPKVRASFVLIVCWIVWCSLNFRTLLVCPTHSGPLGEHTVD